MTRQLCIWTVSFILTAVTVFGQTEIKEKKYKISYTDNTACYAFNYDITIPHLTATSDKDIRNKINDSITSIAKRSFHFFVDGQSTPNFDYTGNPCDSNSISLSPDEITMSYKVFKNTEQFLSITVSVHYIAGGGGHGGGTANYCFNASILNNKLVSIDSLFNPTDKQKLIKLIQTKFDKEQNNTFDNHLGQIKLDGINISDTSFIAHYRVDSAHSIIFNYDVVLSSTDIKHLLVKEYNWLFTNRTKK